MSRRDALHEILGPELAEKILEMAKERSEEIEKSGVAFKGKFNGVGKKAIACPGVDFVLARLKMIAHQLPAATKAKLQNLEMAWESHKSGKAKINVSALAQVLRDLAAQVGDKGLRAAITQCAVDLDKLETDSKGQKGFKGLKPVDGASGWLSWIDKKQSS